ncbi:hypothetical protein WA538_003448, partial [Blastocystis sp. DL]
TTRLQDAFRSVPPSTILYSSICIIVFLIQLIFGGSSSCAISAYYVIDRLEIYRIITSAFTHLGLLHITFNLLSFFSINSSLERRHGSIFMFYTILLFVILNGILYVAIYKLIAWLFIPSANYVMAAGFSGVIFSLLTWQSYESELETIPIFGIVNVPRKWYAVVYLILMSVLVPGVSFIGHLCGVITGFFFATGYLNCLVPMRCLLWLEKGPVGTLFKKSSAFISIPELHQALGSCMSFSTMAYQAGTGLYSLVKMCLLFFVSFLKFIFDSIFPPVIQEEAPLPASGRTSDIESAPVKFTAEEERQRRLEALQARRSAS